MTTTGKQNIPILKGVSYVQILSEALLIYKDTDLLLKMPTKKNLNISK
jgi:hypothetical protein